MKKAILCFVVCVVLSSCSDSHKWEYEVVKVAGQENAEMEDFYPMTFEDQTKMLNEMGDEGWELVDVYTETSTAMPNYGSSEYVTGLRPNTRTAILNFVFKRPQQKQSK